MIYFDNSATTKIDPEVVNAMIPFLNEEYGNPSSKYYTLAENAKKSVEEARIKLANLIGSRDDEIIFTSGASESNNFIIKAIADYSHIVKGLGNHIITTKTEHKSIIETCKWLENRGYRVTYLDVNQYGQVSRNELESVLSLDTILVSIIWGNNELGTLNYIFELSQLCKSKNVPFHSDATQVLGKINIDVQSTPVDFLSFSAHKLHGPKGIGGCFIRKTQIGTKRKMTPLIHGGSQEFGYRAGTHSLHNIVGFGKAAEIAKNKNLANSIIVVELEKKLVELIKKEFPNAVFNNPVDSKIPGILNITFHGISNELLIRKLRNQIALSTGSACSLSEPSYVLRAIGLSEEKIQNTIRLAISKFNTLDDIYNFIDSLKSFR